MTNLVAILMQPPQPLSEEPPFVVTTYEELEAALGKGHEMLPSREWVETGGERGRGPGSIPGLAIARTLSGQIVFDVAGDGCDSEEHF